MKKILEIDKSIEIKSYTQHSYLNAIANRKMIAELSIDDLAQDNWRVLHNDIKFELNSQEDRVTLSEKKNRLSTNFLMERRCKIKDDLILKLDAINVINALSYVKVNVEKLTEEQEQKKTMFSFYWNQYDITLRNKKYTYPEHFYAYYMVKINKNTVAVFISYDKNKWENIFEKKIDFKYTDEIYFKIEVFFGENQYEKWLNMNYIQLFFNDKDSNGVYLDYYTFPRKGIDASYNHACQFIDTEYIEYIKLKENKDFDIRTYIKNSIKNDYYLCIVLDEYYIPDRESYNNSSYEHYNLLFGFDDEKKEYSIIGYNIWGKIVYNAVPYELLEDSIRGGTVVRYRFNVNKYAFEFNIDFLKECISEFVNGKNSSFRYANILTSEEGDYGIKIFDKLLNTKSGFQLFQEDERISYLLYEHALLNKNRLDYLVRKGYICTEYVNDLQEKAIELLKNTERIKNLVIKGRYKPQAATLKENLSRLVCMEKDYFTKLLDCL